MTDLKDLKLDKWQGSFEPEGPIQREFLFPAVAQDAAGAQILTFTS